MINKNIILKILLSIFIGIGVLILPSLVGLLLGCEIYQGSVSMESGLRCGSDPWSLLSIVANLPLTMWWLTIIVGYFIPPIAMLIVLLIWISYFYIVYILLDIIQKKYFSK